MWLILIFLVYLSYAINSEVRNDAMERACAKKIVNHCWNSPCIVIVGDCWELLEIVGNCWKLLEMVRICLNCKTTAPRQDVDDELQVWGIFDLEYQFKRTCSRHGTTVP